MTYRPNPLLARLDRLVAFTGVQARMRQADQDVARPFRLAPLLPIAMAIFGLFIQAYVPMTGWIVIMCAWSGAMTLWFTGPMRLPSGGVRDERERALVRSGHLAGLAAVAFLAIFGCFLMAVLEVASMLNGPIRLPHGPLDWIAAGFFLLVVQSSVAVLVASWLMPRAVFEDEDEIAGQGRR